MGCGRVVGWDFIMAVGPPASISLSLLVSLVADGDDDEENDNFQYTEVEEECNEPDWANICQGFAIFDLSILIFCWSVQCRYKISCLSYLF